LDWRLGGINVKRNVMVFNFHVAFSEFVKPDMLRHKRHAA